MVSARHPFPALANPESPHQDKSWGYCKWLMHGQAMPFLTSPGEPVRYISSLGNEAHAASRMKLKLVDVLADTVAMDSRRLSG